MRSINLFFFISLALVSCPSFGQYWEKYDQNPVLRRDTVYTNLPNDIIAISDGWVIKDASTYKMWYTCGGINYPADTLLRSRICYCESNDGITWNKYAGNPILDVSYTNGWDSLGVETVSVIIDESAPLNERFKMWYAGQYFNAYRYDFGYATSPDGLNWTKHPNPVLQVGNASTWEDGFIEGPSVLKDGAIYKMWYAGYSLTDGKVQIGYATSTDGINWIKYANNPVLSTSSIGWDMIYVQDPHVIKVGNSYHMWYGGADQNDNFGQQTGYASSEDGINWTKSTSNPILVSGAVNEWDANLASFGSVLIDNGIVKMWYTGKDVDPLPANSSDYYWEIGYAADSSYSLGLDENDDLSKFVIYPNPSSSVIHITPESPSNESYQIIISSSTGAILSKETINGMSSSIYISELENGSYILSITDEKLDKYHFNFIISH
jgi:predicted GH43/DUF377 family glycosyl hydrolase